jgi:hypothetical protein
VKTSRRTWIITALEVAFVAVSVWKAPLALGYFTLRMQLRKIEDSARPGPVVQQLLNRADAPPATLNGAHPCVFEPVRDSGVRPGLATCAMPTERTGPVDAFEVDLRYGSFVLRQSDLYVKDVFDVPLTGCADSGFNPNRFAATNFHRLEVVAEKLRHFVILSGAKNLSSM